MFVAANVLVTEAAAIALIAQRITNDRFVMQLKPMPHCTRPAIRWCAHIYTFTPRGRSDKDASSTDAFIATTGVVFSHTPKGEGKFTTYARAYNPKTRCSYVGWCVSRARKICDRFARRDSWSVDCVPFSSSWSAVAFVLWKTRSTRRFPA